MSRVRSLDVRPRLLPFQAASALSIRVDELNRLAESGHLRGVKVNRQWRFSEAEIERYKMQRAGRAPAVDSEPPKPEQLSRAPANPAKWLMGEAIYVLYEYPYNGSIGYVGRSNNPGGRLNGHLGKAYIASKKAEWVHGVLDRGGAIACAIVEWVVLPEVRNAESYWIHEMLRRGHKLSNTVIPEIWGEYTPSTDFDERLAEPVAMAVRCTG